MMLNHVPASTTWARPPEDPCAIAFELVFEMVEMLVARTGRVRHEMVGFDVAAGVPTPARAVRVEDAVGLQPAMQQMLGQWPVVARIYQGWVALDGGSANDETVRREVVVIAMHTRDGVSMATCRIDRSGVGMGASEGWSRGPIATVEKGRLVGTATALND